MKPSLRARAALLPAALAAGCSVSGTTPERDLAAALPLAALDLQVTERVVVGGTHGRPLLRVRFSFVSYEAYPLPDESLRSTATLFLPVDSDGNARAPRIREVVLTEFPPGASASGISMLPEYGEGPTAQFGAAACVVDVRGPVVRRLRRYENPEAPDGAAFRSEEQFAYSALGDFHRTGDLSRVFEWRVARAWLRAIRATDHVLHRETGSREGTYLLAGESYGAIGAAVAASHEPRVVGLVMCGWPLDWADLHFTRWRRWERRARYYPLDALQPIPYRDSAALLSFLFSSPNRPDPGCPDCLGTGDEWRREIDYLDLFRDRLLDGVATLVLVADSDARVPLDLEARASAPPEALRARFPRIQPGEVIAPSPDGAHGPFSDPSARFPFRDLRVLRGDHATLAHAEAVESVLAWVQHLAGYRDVPFLRALEGVESGDVVVDVRVLEGNAPVTGVELWLTEITDRRDSDFKWSAHLSDPEPMSWRRIDALYSGPDKGFLGRWVARFPVDPTRNRAYYILVRDRVGDLSSAHSLPIRAVWHLGDPAVGPARF